MTHALIRIVIDFLEIRADFVGRVHIIPFVEVRRIIIGFVEVHSPIIASMISQNLEPLFLRLTCLHILNIYLIAIIQ